MIKEVQKSRARLNIITNDRATNGPRSGIAEPLRGPSAYPVDDKYIQSEGEQPQ